MINHTTYLVFAAERRLRIAQAERLGHLHGGLPGPARPSRRLGRGRMRRGRRRAAGGATR